MTIQYVAKDGKIFDTKEGCEDYENGFDANLIEVLNKHIENIRKRNKFCQRDKSYTLPEAFKWYTEVRDFVKKNKKKYLKAN